MHVPLAPIQHTYSIVHYNQAEGMIAGLGNPEPFFGHGEPLRERTTFGVAEAQPGPRDCRDAAIGAKAFGEQLSLEERHIPPKTLDGPWIVSRVIIRLPQGALCTDLEAHMPKRGGQGQGALAVVDGTVHLACPPERGAHLGVDLPEPQLITQRLGEGLGVVQMVEYPPRGFCQGTERGA